MQKIKMNGDVIKRYDNGLITVNGVDIKTGEMSDERKISLFCKAFLLGMVSGFMICIYSIV